MKAPFGKRFRSNGFTALLLVFGGLVWLFNASGTYAQDAGRYFVSPRTVPGVPNLQRLNPVQRRTLLNSRATDDRWLRPVLDEMGNRKKELLAESWLFNFVVVNLKEQELPELASAGFTVLPDQVLQLGLSMKETIVAAPKEGSVPPNLLEIRAPQVWEKKVLGSQVRVGVMDGPKSQAHGFHLESVIGYTQGVSVAPLASIFYAHVFNEDGNGYLSHLLEAMEAAFLEGVDVIHISAAGPVVSSRDTFFSFDHWKNATHWAAQLGIPVVVPVGDVEPVDAGKKISPLAFSPNVIVVGGITDDYTSRVIAPFSATVTDQELKNQLEESGRPDFVPDLMAPATAILSLSLPEEDDETEDGKPRYAQRSGTALASAHVAGALALLKSARGGALANFSSPGDSPSIRSMLSKSSNQANFPGGRNGKWGAGLLDALPLIEMVVSETSPLTRRLVLDIRQNDPQAVLHRLQRKNANWEVFFRRYGYEVKTDSAQ